MMYDLRTKSYNDERIIRDKLLIMFRMFNGAFCIKQLHALMSDSDEENVAQEVDGLVEDGFIEKIEKTEFYRLRVGTNSDEQGFMLSELVKGMQLMLDTHGDLPCYSDHGAVMFGIKFDDAYPLYVWQVGRCAKGGD